jgi:hypothetical protein
MWARCVCVLTCTSTSAHCITSWCAWCTSRPSAQSTHLSSLVNARFSCDAKEALKRMVEDCNCAEGYVSMLGVCPRHGWRGASRATR